MKRVFLTLALLLALSTYAFASQIKLTWTNGCVGETNVEVWRSTVSGDTGVLYATLPADAATYTDSTPAIGLDSYRVRCTNGTEMGAWSGWVNVTLTLITGIPTTPIATIIP